MSLIRREGDHGTDVLEPFTPFSRSLFDWPFRVSESLQKMLEEQSIKIDEFMDGDKLVVRAELPGVDPDRDVEVSIVDGSLIIRAERRQEEHTEDRNMRRSEMRYGSFFRSIALPPGAHESDVKASYKDGVLEVRVKVDEQSMKPSKIPIQHQ